jgi:hypothetical protein
MNRRVTSHCHLICSAPFFFFLVSNCSQIGLIPARLVAGAVACVEPTWAQGMTATRVLLRRLRPSFVTRTFSLVFSFHFLCHFSEIMSHERGPMIWPSLSAEAQGVVQNVLTYAEHTSDIALSPHVFCAFFFFFFVPTVVPDRAVSVQNPWWQVLPLALSLLGSTVVQSHGMTVMFGFCCQRLGQLRSSFVTKIFSLVFSQKLCHMNWAQ